MTADGGDYTVHVVVGLDAKGACLLDLWRRRESFRHPWAMSATDLPMKHYD